MWEKRERDGKTCFILCDVHVIITSRRKRKSEISDGWENIEIGTMHLAFTWCDRSTGLVAFAFQHVIITSRRKRKSEISDG